MAGLILVHSVCNERNGGKFLSMVSLLIKCQNEEPGEEASTGTSSISQVRSELLLFCPDLCQMHTNTVIDLTKIEFLGKLVAYVHAQTD